MVLSDVMRKHFVWFLAATLPVLTPLACSSDTQVFEPPPPDARLSDWEVLRGKYFFIKNPDTSLFTQYLELRVYLDDRMAANDVDLGAMPAKTWADAAQKNPADPYRGNFHLLVEDQDYTLAVFLDPSPAPGLILNQPLAPNQALAVAFRGIVDGDTVVVGTPFPTPPDTLELQMIHLPDDAWGTAYVTQSPWAAVAPLERKNIYDLGVRNIDPESFSLRVVRDVAGAGGDNPSSLTSEFGVETPLIQVLGLDQRDNENPDDETPDGKVDDEFIDYAGGLLIFPDFRPFDPSLADIKGTEYRSRSWPKNFFSTRPDTLGWTVDQGSGTAVPSSEAVRAEEVIPEIYDLTYGALQAQALTRSLYAIEVFLGN